MMKLPLISYRTYSVKLPISDTIVRYRPWVSIENKKFLTACLSKNKIIIFEAIIEILKETTFNALPLDDLPSADIEYLFIKVKAASKGEIIELTYAANQERDGIDELIPVELNLLDVELTPLEEKTIHLSGGIGVEMKFPSFTDSLKIEELEDEYEKIAHLVDFVFDEKNVYKVENKSGEFDVSYKETTEWLKKLLDTDLEKIIKFTTSLPTIRTTISFFFGIPPIEKKIELVGLHDFFL